MPRRIAFTAAPWTCGAGRTIDTPHGTFYLTYGYDRYMNPLWKGPFSELDDNARMIALCPQLYVALRGLLYNVLHGNGSAAWDDSIAKARAVLTEIDGQEMI